MTAKRSVAKAILIIEDEPHVADMLFDFFTRAHYRTERYVGARLVEDATESPEAGTADSVEAVKVPATVELLELDGTYTEFDPSRYVVAVIDGRVRGSELKPRKLGKLLHGAGLSVAFMSGPVDLLTPQMKDTCAEAGLQTKSFLDGLIHGMIDLRKLH